MLRFAEWFPPSFVGTVFTTVGLLKIYGFRRGIMGGPGRPVSCRLLGRCPTWSSNFNNGMVALFLGIGLINLAIAIRVLWRAS